MKLMEDMHLIKENYDIDYTSNLVSFLDLFKLQERIACKFGPLLKQYLLIYGYIGFKSIEFYGINSKQFENSDLITQTLYLHKYYTKTVGLIAFENQGEGDYYLVDSNDKVFCYNSETDHLQECNLDLIEYILKRFKEVENGTF